MKERDRTITTSAPQRLARLQKLSRLLDSAIPLPGGYRIGIDGMIGLIPGVGDIVGGVASGYIIIEAARLGASTATLIHMIFNVLLEAVVGLIPIIGDLFDFVWKSNEKNMALLERQQRSHPASTPEHRIQAAVLLILFTLFAALAGLAYLGFLLLLRLAEILAGNGPP